MTGAEILLTTLAANRVEVCFMNPGTSEMHFVAALDRVAGCRGVLCLFEGVCAGAADGYARITGRPAATLVHLGPGLGNALANFHNARKARSPVVSIVGEHTRHHLTYDAPLSADVAAFARPVSEYVRTVMDADEVGRVPLLTALQLSPRRAALPAMGKANRAIARGMALIRNTEDCPRWFLQGSITFLLATARQKRESVEIHRVPADPFIPVTCTLATARALRWSV